VGLTLYTACQPRAVVAHQVLWAAAQVFGSRVLPGARECWAPPIDDYQFGKLRQQWSDLVGGIDYGLAIYERLQSERRNLTVLVCAGRRSLLVRVRTDPMTLERERRISAAAAEQRPRTFNVPVLRGRGQAGAYHWVAYEAMALRPHIPVRRPDKAIFGEITQLVESVVDRPNGVPAHWTGSHGDFNPWNLRRAQRRTWLIDWEDSGWAPPGADEVYFRAVSAALRRGPVKAVPIHDEHGEAARYWAHIVADRAASSKEQVLHERLLDALTA
jgi:hypothetical protein